MLLLIILFNVLPYCAAQSSQCDEEFCFNGGTCLYPNKHCSCPQGWSGSRCQIAQCDNWFCLNGGKCHFPNINCTCTEGWTGNRCSTRVKFNHTMIIYICIGVIFLMNGIIALMFVGVICYLRKKTWQSRPTSHREKDDLWMQATSRRYQLVEVIREADNKLKDVKEKECGSPDNFKQKAPVDVTKEVKKTDVKPEPRSSGIVEMPSTQSMLDITEVSETSDEARQKSTSDLNTCISKLEDPVDDKISNETLVPVKTSRDISHTEEIAEEEVKTSSKKPLHSPPFIVGHISANTSFQKEKEHSSTSSISPRKPSSEEYYSVPDHIQSTSGASEDYSIQRAVYTAHDSHDKKQECTLTSMKATPKIAYGALQHHMKTSTTSEDQSSDDVLEIEVYKV